MVTIPHFQRVDAIRETCTGMLGPSVLLTECGPGFSVVIAADSQWNPEEEHLILESPIHLHIDSDGVTNLRSTAGIEVSLDPRWRLWVSKDKASGLPLPSPSVEPFLILFSSAEDHALLRSAVRYQNTDAIFEFCRQRIAVTEGFSSPDSDTLISPPQYACARDQGPWRVYF